MPDSDIKNHKWLEELSAYLDRKGDCITCYILRDNLGLRNSGNPVEKANDLLVAQRQKHNGMAWSPLVQGKNNLFTNETLVEIGEKYGKTAAQVNLRFLIQPGVVVIPKSTHKERMEENFNLFDFSLTDAEINRFKTLDLGKSQFIDYYAPDVAEMFVNAGKV